MFSISIISAAAFSLAMNQVVALAFVASAFLCTFGAIFTGAAEWYKHEKAMDEMREMRRAQSKERLEVLMRKTDLLRQGY